MGAQTSLTLDMSEEEQLIAAAATVIICGYQHKRRRRFWIRPSLTLVLYTCSHPRKVRTAMSPFMFGASSAHTKHGELELKHESRTCLRTCILAVWERL